MQNKNIFLSLLHVCYQTFRNLSKTFLFVIVTLMFALRGKDLQQMVLVRVVPQLGKLNVCLRDVARP